MDENKIWIICDTDGRNIGVFRAPTKEEALRHYPVGSLALTCINNTAIPSEFLQCPKCDSSKTNFVSMIRGQHFRRCQECSAKFHYTGLQTW